MNNLLSTFQDRYSDWLTALTQHLKLSVLTLVIAIVLAVPLAVLVSRSKRSSEFILQVAGVFQTIPSLAILGLLIPVMGIGTLPALIALVIYALFPILQSTITGLEEIDPVLIEAGTAFGMTKWERLKKFELELAMPMIMSGIRTSAVMIVGTATLAALIGAGGLGSFILLGIDRNNSSLIVIGAISSAILAIIINYLLKLLSKAKLKTTFVFFMILAIGIGLSYSPSLIQKNNGNIIVAGKMGPEPEILMNMYKILIEKESNISVTVKPNFGKTNFIYEALLKGDIDIYPEFSGTITESLLKNPPKTSHNPNVVYKNARDEILKQDNLLFLKPMQYQNTFAIAVPQKIAKEYNLENISDLKRVEDKLKAGFTLEFNDRLDGNKGIQTLYGVNLNVATMEPSIRYKAVESGEVQIIEVFSTDPEIQKYKLKILKDDKGLFPPYQGAPLMKKSLQKKYPKIKNILNKLSGKISESDMSKMNYQVGVNGESAYQVALNYLKYIHLVN